MFLPCPRYRSWYYSDNFQLLSLTLASTPKWTTNHLHSYNIPERNVARRASSGQISTWSLWRNLHHVQWNEICNLIPPHWQSPPARDHCSCGQADWQRGLCHDKLNPHIWPNGRDILSREIPNHFSSIPRCNHGHWTGIEMVAYNRRFHDYFALLIA